MSGRVQNQIRAYPIRPVPQRSSTLQALISHYGGEVRPHEGVGDVLVVDWLDDGAGIDFYHPLIGALHAEGLHVFAQNLTGGRAPARREFWHPDGWRNSWPIDPDTGEQLVEIGAVAEALADEDCGEEVLSLLRMATPPPGLFELRESSSPTLPVARA